MKVQKNFGLAVNQTTPNTLFNYNSISTWTGEREELQRGIDIYNISQLTAVTGRDENGQLLTWGVEQPLFYISVRQRAQIAELCSPVFGIVTSRMNSISSKDFNIVSEKEEEDKIADKLKGFYQVYKERSNLIDPESLMIKAQVFVKTNEYLKDLLPDFSNFSGSLLRWKKRIQTMQTERAQEIKDWLMEPNQGVTWEDFVKKVVFDLMIHGNAAIYKQEQDGRIENFDTLVGGTIYKLKTPFFSTTSGFAQIIPGFEPQIFFNKEICFMEYYPVTFKNHSMIPLEALINLVSEKMLFDNLMAEQADGTKPPNKLVIGLNGFNNIDQDLQIPMDIDKQERLETKLNNPVKHGVITFSGNDVKVVDLTRDNTLATQMERQKDIREEVALVFNASNMELNLTGSESTSGRESGKEQGEIDRSRGSYPIQKTLASKVSSEIIPFRFGYGWKLEYPDAKDDFRKEQLDSLRLANGKITINELREDEGNFPFEGEEFDKPQGFEKVTPDGTEVNPFNMKNI